ncbi:hypothetical protein IQ266_24200 [filamentous cyanobacterium LEGE 11480]|uniref:Uncharacterized protein n=1 Tax=Romeriopsis navalis LEGE 11480 TaxID=2777977 RepID=A0A928VUM8_9CYAN|nr:hypothetical protein [Romeriopsis navalis]MBE9032842.1 hypothetical protein [Romeriopsis navalis LEGE 11480]
MRPGVTISKTVQDFLNVAGIVGFALMDGPQLDYFRHLNGTLQPQDKALFAQNVAQVLETIPTEFFELELQLQTHWTHLYRLDRSKVFVVWLGNAADRQRYASVLPPLLQVLKDIPGPVLDQLHALTAEVAAPSLAAPSFADPVESEPVMLPTLHDVLQVMNQVIAAGVEYLGKRILSNQVLMARPHDIWLSPITFDMQEYLVASPQMSLHQPLTIEQYRSLKQWVDGIIQAVRRVIRDFREILERQLSPFDQSLLFDPVA